MKLPLADIGTESEKGVVAALDDLFGPSFRVLGEYLADKVKYHRLRSLQKIIRKAKEFGPDGVAFVSPPPMKFLLPFVEASSLEEEDDEVMSDIWAKLLSDASTEYDAKQLHFIRVLREISGNEARLLHAMATEYRGELSSGMVYHGEYGAAQQFLTPYHDRLFLRDILHSLPTNQIAQEFIRRHETAGSHIYYIDVAERDGPSDLWETAEDGLSGYVTEMQKAHGQITFELLRAVSLIEEIRCDMIEDGGTGFEFKAWAFTGLGGEFYDHCASAAFPEESRQTPSA